MFGLKSKESKSAGLVQKMNQTIQNAIQSLFKVRWSPLPRRATSEYLELFHTSPRLDALDMIATDCANAVFKVYRKADLRTGKEDATPIEDHPIYELLENPMPDHPEFDGFMVRYLTHVYVELNGECFWILLRDTKGVPREIYPIPALWCIQTPTEAQPWYLIVPQKNTAGRSMQIDPRDVIWFKSPDITSPYGRGRGRTEAVGDELETDEFAAKYAKNFFWNNAKPESIMTIPEIDEASLKAFKADWNQKHQGILNASKMGFLGFDAKMVSLQTTPREMDFNESRKFLRDLMDGHWRVPPEVMGRNDTSNRATIESADYLYKKNVVSPRTLRWETAVNRQLMPMFGAQWAIKCDNLVPEDKTFNLELANAGWTSGALTRDQWLRMNGLPPIGGELGSQFLIPINLVATSSTPMRDVTPVIDEVNQEAGAAQIADETSPDQSHPVTTTTDTQPVIDTPSAARPIEDDGSKSVKRRKVFSGEQRKAVWTAFDKAATSTEEPFKTSVKRFAESQKGAFQRAFQKNIADGRKPKEAADRATLAAFNPKIDEALKTSLTPAWLGSMKAGEDHALMVLGIKKKSAKAGVSGGFGINNPKFTEWVAAHGLDKARDINDTTLEKLKKQLQDVIAEGIDEGMSERDVAKAIMDVSDGVWENMDSVRAQLIARTESGASVNFGTKETYRDQGVGKKEWGSALDDRTRDDHLEADGQIVDIDESFSVGGESLEYPGDPSGDAANVCNCRCFLLPVIEEE